MASTLPKGECATCGSKGNPSRCGGCKVVQYCCRDDQVADRPAHKEVCNKIKKTREALERAEQDLRAQPADIFLPENVFETGVGHFWGYPETRPYMRARYGHVEALLKVKTYEAVEAALEHVMDMHRLCRSDNMGVRDLTPHIFLRLGKDQESYDFIKWYATMGRKSDYDWGDMDLPFLNVKNADVFEPVDLHVQKYGDLSHTVAVTLIKIRLLADLKALQKSRLVSGKIPQELLDIIRGQLVSTIVSSNEDIMARKDQSGQIKQLEKQIEQLYQAVHKANKHFWPALLNPGRNLVARPEYFSSGDNGEMQIVLQYSYPAWTETPGAIDVIKAKLEEGATTHQVA